MTDKLTRISIKGFKSIRDCSVKLGDMNVLIGPNGAGKSNFLSAFSLVQRILSKELQLTLSRCGVPSLLYNGPKETDGVSIEVEFGDESYGFSLELTDDERMVFTEEHLRKGTDAWNLGRGHFESKTTADMDGSMLCVDTWRVYHFHDTSRNAPVKRSCSVHDNVRLRQDAGNLASFLLRLKAEYPSDYARIASTVRMVNPFFEDFVLIPNESTEEVVLRWKKIGTDEIMGPNQFSDGTLRFICLTALLLQPANMLPKLVILDEPELGLFPQAMVFLSEMIEMVGRTNQVIVSTQSTDLVDDFCPEDIMIVEDEGRGTVFKRPDLESLNVWLENDYTLGTLWKKNVLRGA